MFLAQILCALCVLLSYASAMGYGSGGSGAGGGYGGGSGGGYGGGSQMSMPRPYQFGYEAQNDGGSSFHNEKGDGSGSVQGSYGYTDSQGLFRKVDYIADAGGFRASVKTNEPGVDGKESPASTSVSAQQPPMSVMKKYSGSSGYGGGSGAGGYGGMSGGYGGMGGGMGGMGKSGGMGGAGMFSGIPRSSSGKSGY